MDRDTFLTAVDAELRRELAQPLVEAVRPLALAPKAKRARPALVYALGAAAGADPAALVGPAVAIELIHTASLVHDDVVDEADERRGVPSVNAAEGNAVAVLAGDDLLVRALERLDEPLRLEALRVLRAMTTSALLEHRWQSAGSNPGAGAWRDMAAGKTGALFSLCGTAAGAVARDELRARRFHQAGMHLGIMFQIADDITDANGDAGPNIAVIAGTETSLAMARDELARAKEALGPDLAALGDVIRWAEELIQ